MCMMPLLLVGHHETSKQVAFYIRLRQHAFCYSIYFRSDRVSASISIVGRFEANMVQGIKPHHSRTSSDGMVAYISWAYLVISHIHEKSCSACICLFYTPSYIVKFGCFSWKISRNFYLKFWMSCDATVINIHLTVGTYPVSYTHLRAHET